MQYDEDFIERADADTIAYRAWRCRAPRATILLVHGMAEHMGRYAQFGEMLTDHDINLVGFDLSGHGEHCDPQEQGQLTAWDDLFASILAMKQQAEQWEPGVPLFIMGHSLGGYICLDFLSRHHVDGLSGAIISGAGLNQLIELKVGLVAAKFERWRLGAEGKSALLNTLSFKKFNNAFKPNETDFDWLSRDSDAVNAYIEDPWCGFSVSNQFWIDIAQANIRIARPQGLDNFPIRLPVMVFCGENDPVSRFGKGVELLSQALGGGKMDDLSVKQYTDARHEMLFELSKDEVMADIVAWITARIPPAVGAE